MQVILRHERFNM